MTKASLMLLVVLGAVLVAFAFQASADAQTGASSAIDRSFVCQTEPSGGIREIEARANSGIRDAASLRWRKLPFAVVATGGVRSVDKILENSLAWISAGRPAATTTIDFVFTGASPQARGTVAVNARLCRATATRIPLSPAGLVGRSPGQLGEIFDCTSPRRVVVRVRAVLPGASTLRRSGGFLRSTDPVMGAAIAVRTESGKPLVYAEVFQAGKTNLFTARSCTED